MVSTAMTRSEVTHLNDGVRVDVREHGGLFCDIRVAGAIDLYCASVPRVNSTN
jgi:hypothetical protein